MKDFIQKIICGVAIGIGCVLPGVSGGVIAIAMGLYEKMLDAIKSLLFSFKKSFIFLLPLGIGCVIGVLLTSNVLKLVIDNYESELFALFAGFVIGSYPTLFEETKRPGEKRFSAGNIAIMLIAFAAVVFLEIVDTNATGRAAEFAEGMLSPWEAVLAGAILSIGVVIPGLSSSFLLVYFGMYKPILTAIAEVEIRTLFFAGIGFSAAAAVLVLIMHFLLSKYHVKAYFGIIGVAVGTIALIVPNILRGFSWVSLLLLIAGLAVGFWQSSRQIQMKKRNAEMTMPM